jgi:hypothetical protein
MFAFYLVTAPIQAGHRLLYEMEAKPIRARTTPSHRAMTATDALVLLQFS